MKRGALAAGLVAVTLWGLAPVATRAAVAHLSPLPLLTLRMAAATLVLLPWAVPVFRRLRPRSAGRLAAAGLLGLVGYNLPVTAGLRWLPAATAGLLLATEPVWVMVLGRVFLGERGGVRTWLGSACALAGVGVLAGPGAITGAGGYRALAGTGLVLAGTLAFAAYTIVLRPLSKEFGAVPATAASTAVGTLPYLPFAWTLPGAGLAHLGAGVWFDLGFLALGSTAAGMLLWNIAVLSGGAARVSLLLYLEPVVSVVGAAVFLGERVVPVTLGGGALILAGVAVASTGLARRHGSLPSCRSADAPVGLPAGPACQSGKSDTELRKIRSTRCVSSITATLTAPSSSSRTAPSARASSSLSGRPCSRWMCAVTLMQAARASRCGLAIRTQPRPSKTIGANTADSPGRRAVAPVRFLPVSDPSDAPVKACSIWLGYG